MPRIIAASPSFDALRDTSDLLQISSSISARVGANCPSDTSSLLPTGISLLIFPRGRYSSGLGGAGGSRGSEQGQVWRELRLLLGARNPPKVLECSNLGGEEFTNYQSECTYLCFGQD